jgi:hypothetical protein
MLRMKRMLSITRAILFLLWAAYSSIPDPIPAQPLIAFLWFYVVQLLFTEHVLITLEL